MMHKTCSINYGHLADLQKTLPTADLNKKKFHVIKYLLRLLATFLFSFLFNLYLSDIWAQPSEMSDMSDDFCEHWNSESIKLHKGLLEDVTNNQWKRLESSVTFAHTIYSNFWKSVDFKAAFTLYATRRGRMIGFQWNQQDRSHYARRDGTRLRRPNWLLYPNNRAESRSKRDSVGFRHQRNPFPRIVTRLTRLV